MTPDRDDIVYYKRRLASELEAASAATEPHARMAHRQLADRYEAMIAELRAIDGGTFEPAFIVS